MGDEEPQGGTRETECLRLSGGGRPAQAAHRPASGTRKGPRLPKAGVGRGVGRAVRPRPGTLRWRTRDIGGCERSCGKGWSLRQNCGFRRIIVQEGPLLGGTGTSYHGCKHGGECGRWGSTCCFVLSIISVLQLQLPCTVAVSSDSVFCKPEAALKTLHPFFLRRTAGVLCRGCVCPRWSLSFFPRRSSTGVCRVSFGQGAVTCGHSHIEEWSAGGRGAGGGLGGLGGVGALVLTKAGADMAGSDPGVIPHALEQGLSLL